MRKSQPVSTLSNDEDIPKVWDGFGFFRDDDGTIKFYFFDENSQKYGPLTGDPSIPADRIAFHVILSSARRGRVHIEIPFTSNFLDPFVYARRVAHAGFTGVMIKENHVSLALAEQFLKEIMWFHASEYGFVLKNDEGKDIFYPGKKKEQPKEKV